MSATLRSPPEIEAEGEIVEVEMRPHRGPFGVSRSCSRWRLQAARPPARPGTEGERGDRLPGVRCSTEEHSFVSRRRSGGILQCVINATNNGNGFCASWVLRIA